MQIVTTLKSQHREVERLVAVLNDAHARGDIVTLKKNLAELKKALLAHLALEDLELYPALAKAAGRSKDDHMAVTVKRFSTNMERIGTGLKAFFAKWEKEPSIDLKRFSTEWKSIVTTLSTRITAEEASLYPLYAKNVPALADTGP